MGIAREQRPVERIARPFQGFVHRSVCGGILLIAAAVAALAWANSPWEGSHAAFWGTEIAMGMGDLSLSKKDLNHWVNDGLMAVFFLVVGLEIKREVFVEELSSFRGAALPVVTAGGAVVPALIYAAINSGTEGAAGRGIPMATDIAFALGVLALLGERAPVGLKVFLGAEAVKIA
jgi:NhaA family Na+:H+ antiporter